MSKTVLAEFHPLQSQPASIFCNVGYDKAGHSVLNLTMHVRKFHRSLEVTAAYGLHRCRVWNGLEGLR